MISDINEIPTHERRKEIMVLYDELSVNPSTVSIHFCIFLLRMGMYSNALICIGFIHWPAYGRAYSSSLGFLLNLF